MVRWGSIAIAAAVGAWAHGLAATLVLLAGERYVGTFLIFCALAWAILMLSALICRANQAEREDLRHWREHERATLELKADLKREEVASRAEAAREAERQRRGEN